VRLVAADTEAMAALKVKRSEERILVIEKLDYVCCEKVRLDYRG
jgi:hypothetical protein